MSSMERYRSVYFQSEVQARRAFQRSPRGKRLIIASCVCLTCAIFAFWAIFGSLSHWGIR